LFSSSWTNPSSFSVSGVTWSCLSLLCIHFSVFIFLLFFQEKNKTNFESTVQFCRDMRTTTLSITILSIKGFFDIQHNNTAIMLGVNMLSVAFYLSCYHYAEFRYAECLCWVSLCWMSLYVESCRRDMKYLSVLAIILSLQILSLRQKNLTYK